LSSKEYRKEENKNNSNKKKRGKIVENGFQRYNKNLILNCKDNEIAVKWCSEVWRFKLCEEYAGQWDRRSSK
jgi:hypothetical protein